MLPDSCPGPHFKNTWGDLVECLCRGEPRGFKVDNKALWKRNKAEELIWPKGYIKWTAG